jgi:hypothetical protein
VFYYFDNANVIQNSEITKKNPENLKYF